MPRTHKSWSCLRCHKRFGAYADAEKCELGHIVDDASQGFRLDLDRILVKPAPGGLPALKEEP